MIQHSNSTPGRANVGSWSFTATCISVLMSLMLLASCTVGPDYQTPTAKFASEWSAPLVGASVDPGTVNGYWWKSLNDPVLDQLIEIAFTNNLSLQIAGVRILQARAQLNKSVGNLFPQQQGLSGDVDYRELNGPVPSTAPGLTPNYTSDQVLFAATWEIDVWGKFRRGIESDRAQFVATVASYDDAMVTLIADLASTYVNIRTTEERLSVARTNIGILKESLRIATAQYDGGETSELDVQQANTVLAQTQSQIPQLESTLHQSKNALAVLIGETPESVDQYIASGSIPTAPPVVASGIPRDLLRRRPDVREAGLNAAAQCALIGVARAQMYPAFSLSGAFGFSSSNEGDSSLADMFSWQSRAVQAGASFVFPVFNYGRLVNQVRVQDAQFQQAILNYQNTVLQAQQEVQNGLTTFAAAQQSLAFLQVGAASAGRSTQLSMAQYKEGETDYTTVLSTEQAQLSLDDSLASARGNVVQGLISVYRALGGGWEIRLGRDVVSESVKAEMGERTHWGDLLDTTSRLPNEFSDEQSAPKKQGPTAEED
jgi:NodT family efflux transporter outer membrane factor (OMF) lipoprotein